MERNSNKIWLIVPGTALALMAGGSIIAGPLLLKLLIQRRWLYGVDAAPLDHRLLALSIALLAISASLLAILLRPQWRLLPRQRMVPAAALLLLLLVPLKNGSVSNSVFFSLAGLASVLLWKAGEGRMDRAGQAAARAWRTLLMTSDAGWRLGLFLAGAAVYLAVAGSLFQRMPHCIDEVDYLFQARIFAQGNLWAPLPPLPDFFHFINLIQADGKWFSQYPPGWPALLALGVIVHAPWIVNPLLGGLLLVMISQLARDLDREETARIAGLLAMGSPYLILMNASMMAHTSRPRRDRFPPVLSPRTRPHEPGLDGPRRPLLGKRRHHPALHRFSPRPAQRRLVHRPLGPLPPDRRQARRPRLGGDRRPPHSPVRL
jgi:hypothetical protein